MVICVVQSEWDGCWDAVTVMPQRAAVVGTEEYGARRVDGPVVSEPDLLDCSDRYIVWQNFVNSYQIYKKDRKVMKNQI